MKTLFTKSIFFKKNLKLHIIEIYYTVRNLTKLLLESVTDSVYCGIFYMCY